MTQEKHPRASRSSSVAGHPTPQAAVLDQLDQYMRQTGADLADFAQDLAVAYAAYVPEDQQTLSLPLAPPQTGGDAYLKWIDGLRKKVQRWRDGDVRLPAEILWAWPAALPEPYRTRCIHDLCAGFGVLPVAIPDEETTAEHMGELLEAAGAEATNAGPVFADGRMTEADAAHLPAFIRACEDSAAKSLSMAARGRTILRRLGKGNTPSLREVK